MNAKRYMERFSSLGIEGDVEIIIGPTQNGSEREEAYYFKSGE